MSPRCAKCGGAFKHAPSRAGGRPPKHCPTCRRPRGKPIDPKAVLERRNKLRRAQRAGTAESKAAGAERVSRASRLAAGLAVLPDPGEAAASVGIAAVGDELEDLVALARRLYPDVAAGRVEGTARVVTRTIHLLAQQLQDTAHLLAPRDLATAARQLGQIREVLVGREGAREQWTSIEVGIMGPDNRLEPV